MILSAPLIEPLARDRRQLLCFPFAVRTVKDRALAFGARKRSAGSRIDSIETGGEVKDLQPGLFHPASKGGQLLTLVILDRKSTRLNSSHVAISYAVFCLKKKN